LNEEFRRDYRACAGHLMHAKLSAGERVVPAHLFPSLAGHRATDPAETEAALANVVEKVGGWDDGD
jgi:hypothetical protein